MAMHPLTLRKKDRRKEAGKAGRSLRLLAAGSTLLLAAGCSLLPSPQADPAHFYVLTARPVQPAADAHARSGGLVVGLSEVELPRYLQTQSLVVRVGVNELQFRDEARWGESLAQGIARVLREELAAAPGVAQIVSRPGPPDRDRDVVVHVLACEGAADGTVRFAARWEIVTLGAGDGVVAHGTYESRGLTWNGRDYGGLAQRLSEALAGLGTEIAAALAR
jgi:uncharacterized lipoprotein YmbA